MRPRLLVVRYVAGGVHAAPGGGRNRRLPIDVEIQVGLVALLRTAIGGVLSRLAAYRLVARRDTRLVRRTVALVAPARIEWEAPVLGSGRRRDAVCVAQIFHDRKGTVLERSLH